MGMTAAARSTNLHATPSDWRVFSLQNLATLERGKFSARPRNDPRYFGGPYPFIQTGDVANSHGTVNSYSQTLNEDGLRVSRLFPPNTLFFTIAANIGDVAIAPFATACPDSLIAISPNSRADQSWLFYALGSRKRIFESLATQNAQLNINLEKLRPYELAVPPVPEQKAIAAALGDVDALLRALERLIAKKRDLKQAAIQQLLTGQTRLPGFSGNWESKRLGDVLDRVIGGGTPSRDIPDYWGGSIPWATVKDFATFHPRGTQESITTDGLRNSASNLVPSGTLITSTRMALGRAVVFEVDVAINQDLKALFVKNGHSVDFLRHWFALKAREIDEMGSGSTVKGISVSDLKNLEFALVPKDEQFAIATVLSDMDAELAALEQRRDKTRLLKQGMMQELLTGRTRLV